MPPDTKPQKHCPPQTQTAARTNLALLAAGVGISQDNRTYVAFDRVSALTMFVVAQALEDPDDWPVGGQHGAYLVARGLVVMLQDLIESGDYPAWLDALWEDTR